jgi:hypothetical protein
MDNTSDIFGLLLFIQGRLSKTSVFKTASLRLTERPGYPDFGLNRFSKSFPKTNRAPENAQPAEFWNWIKYKTEFFPCRYLLTFNLACG